MGRKEARAEVREEARAEVREETRGETKEGTRNRAQGIHRQVKDRLFRYLFSRNREALLQLYNGLNGTDYRDVAAMEIVTIEGAVYIVMKNDLAFVIADTISLYEHQSTMGGNLAVRFLIYLAEEYQTVIERAKRSLYGSRTIVLPAPKCVVFYNGASEAGREAADEWEVSLSDAFAGSGRSAGADVDVRVRVVNINYGHNGELMEKCPLLKEYARFVAIGRQYTAEGLELREAYERTVEYCIGHDILRQYLEENRAEVLGMILEEFDAEKYEWTIREEGREEGREQGREEGREQGLVQGCMNTLFALVQQGLLSVRDAAGQAAMTEQAFCEAMRRGAQTW